jgi:hypothetical protein
MGLMDLCDISLGREHEEGGGRGAAERKSMNLKVSEKLNGLI